MCVRVCVCVRECVCVCEGVCECVKVQIKVQDIIMVHSTRDLQDYKIYSVTT